VLATIAISSRRSGAGTLNLFSVISKSATMRAETLRASHPVRAP
jgi:hypothetical protein